MYVIYDMDVYELISIAGCDKAMPNVAYNYSVKYILYYGITTFLIQTNY